MSSGITPCCSISRPKTSGLALRVVDADHRQLGQRQVHGAEQLLLDDGNRQRLVAVAQRGLAVARPDEVIGLGVGQQRLHGMLVAAEEGQQPRAGRRAVDVLDHLDEAGAGRDGALVALLLDDGDPVRGRRDQVHAQVGQGRRVQRREAALGAAAGPAVVGQVHIGRQRPQHADRVANAEEIGGHLGSSRCSRGLSPA
jgi:hypothetical protein